MTSLLPSNCSFDEIIKYGRLPEQAVKALEQVQDRLIELEKENKALNRRNEVIFEQWCFCKEFISSTKERCQTATKCKELVAAILTELDDSYIEL